MNMAALRWSLPTLGSSSTTFIYTEAITGLITSATKSDELKTMMSVIGRYFMNSPMRPGQKARGRKAATVVAVDAMIAQGHFHPPLFGSTNGAQTFRHEAVHILDRHNSVVHEHAQRKYQKRAPSYSGYAHCVKNHKAQAAYWSE